MTRASWFVSGVVLGLAAICAEGTARAQQQVVGSPAVPCSASPGAAAAPVVGPGGSVGVGVGVGGGATSIGASSPAIMPYSYYVNFPAPSRVYVGYGANDRFPYQGQAYGHAGDRWSWSAMSTGNNSLARYYYQILP